MGWQQLRLLHPFKSCHHNHINSCSLAFDTQSIKSSLFKSNQMRYNVKLSGLKGKLSSTMFQLIHHQKATPKHSSDSETIQTLKTTLLPNGKRYPKHSSTTSSQAHNTTPSHLSIPIHQTLLTYSEVGLVATKETCLETHTTANRSLKVRRQIVFTPFFAHQKRNDFSKPKNCLRMENDTILTTLRMEKKTKTERFFQNLKV